MYKFIKFVCSVFLDQFFTEIRLKGAEKIESGPLLIAVNHPNLALDSMVVAKSFKRDLWFLAKSTLFANSWLSKFFRSCHMIPVFRKQDSEGGALDNRETFKQVVDILCESKAVAIFPEGVSLGLRKILPLKTGAARMAFEAEETRNFALGLKIQVVGLTYSQIDSFRSRVTLTLASPIMVSDFKEEYERDAQLAVRSLTDRISSELKNVTVEIAEQKHVELVEKISSVYRHQDPDVDDKELMHLIARNIEKYSPAELDSSKNIVNRIDIYNHLASLFGLDEVFSLEKPLNKFLATLSLPLFAIAYLINLVPYRVTGELVKRRKVEEVYSASAKFGFGVLVFSAWYIFISLCSQILLGGSFINFILTLLLCLASGYLLNRYLDHIKLLLLSSFWPFDKKPLDLLRLLRSDLISELNAMRRD